MLLKWFKKWSSQPVVFTRDERYQSRTEEQVVVSANCLRFTDTSEPSRPVRGCGNIADRIVFLKEKFLW